MKIAVVGAGIAGIAAAHQLQRLGDVVLYEAGPKLGGHTDTHNIHLDGITYPVDSGFIVFNRRNYPLFSQWLDDLAVASRPSDMSFAVQDRTSGLTYGTRNLDALFCQRRNALRPAFLRMLHDIRRFYREAASVSDDDERTLADFLLGRFSDYFVHRHLIPMCSALWSLPMTDALSLPVAHVIAFMNNHRMLQLSDRPQWLVVDGGSSRYLSAFTQSFSGQIRTRTPVLGVRRCPASAPERVLVRDGQGEQSFDHLVLACHSDQALALLEDAAPEEQDILGAIRYQSNRVVVHSDKTFMPEERAAWSSWNVQLTADVEPACRVTYWMNNLQSLGHRHAFFVSLNPEREPSRIWAERQYQHPVFDARARAAQQRHNEISGTRRTHYCGAYWGWGFHEDGFRSGIEAAKEIQNHARLAA